MAAGFADIEDSEEVCCLSGRSQHTRGTAFESCDLGCNIVVGRIL